MSKFAAILRAASRIPVSVCAFIGFVFMVVTVTPLTALWATRLAQPWNNDHGDVLIILSGDSLGDNVAGVTTYWRCLYGAQAWRLGGFRQILITGDSVVGPMRELLIFGGVPAAMIRVESQSGSTRESAVHCRPILHGMSGKNVLLTSDYHMFRARRAFSKAGIETGVWVIPDVTKRSRRWRERWPAFLDLTVEDCKIGYYYLKGWV